MIHDDSVFFCGHLLFREDERYPFTQCHSLITPVGMLRVQNAGDGGRLDRIRCQPGCWTLE
jgi:hypothetical protein